MGTFDPYHKWLAIPPAEQPPNHYRLLGVPLYETDLEVIETAADRQMSYIRQCATGPHTKESQQILNELSAVRVCLLNAAKRKAYDAELKARLAPPAPEPRSTVSRPRVTRVPVDRKGANSEGDDAFPMVVLERQVPDGELALSRRRYSKKRAPTNAYWLWGAAGALGLVLLWGIVHLASQPGTDASPPAGNAVTAAAPVDPSRASQNNPPAGAAAKAKTARAEPRRSGSPAGASEKPATDDLLKQIALNQNTIRGEWKFDGAALVSPATQFALMQIPVTPPESYVLRATVEATAIQDCVSIGLVTGATQVTVVLSGWQGTISGLQLVDQKLAAANETRTGSVLLAGTPNEVVCTVTPGKVQVVCNGKQSLTWSGHFSRLLAGPDWQPPHPHQLYLGTNLTSYRISKLELEPLQAAPSAGEESPPPQIVVPLSVVNAVYGSGDTKVDLTARMQKGAQTGLLVAFVEPALVDGKASGDLVIRYQVGNLSTQKTFRHREFVFLDVRQQERVPDKGLVIRDALYGAGIWGEGRMVDVKQRLSAHVKEDRVKVTVKDLVAGLPDPASGVSKILIVRHASNGGDVFRWFEEHMTVELGSP